MLQIKNLSKTYDGEKWVVDDVSLEIRDGEIFGFIGHNGAGKTTTIKCASGLLSFEKGEILIDNISIKENPLECKRKIAYIPDNPDLYETLTASQYLNFICDVFGISKEERNVLIEKYAKIFQLETVLGDIISSYSHGMKQKLALIGALIHKPKLLFLDEPFVGLDPKAAFLVKEIMKELCDQGSSVFFSTHVLEVAEKLCDRIAIIKNGKIVAMGDTKEITKDKSLETVFLELANE
ncbi:MAG: ABC transporter ATP-binding protein [Bacilli bacterium]|nr:ABC transporter ATP-binding protein [Bacilli bacterium]